MESGRRNDLDELHNHVSNALLACSRCIERDGVLHPDLLEVAKLLTAAQSRLCKRQAGIAFDARTRR